MDDEETKTIEEQETGSMEQKQEPEDGRLPKGRRCPHCLGPGCQGSCLG